MNKKLKKVIVSLLSVLMLMAYMPAMAFADEVVLSGANVTTDETTEPIHYDTFEEALHATNVDANAETNAVITLLEDAALTELEQINIPMTIKLNGHTLTEDPVAFDPAKGSWGANPAGICRKDGVGEIIFKEHALAASTVYNWAKRENNDAWHVVSMQAFCENCGQHETEIREATYPDRNVYRTTPAQPTLGPDGKYTYQFQGTERRQGRWQWTTLTTKVIDGPEADKYVLSGTTQIVVVNGINQHKDGLPVVKAEMKDAVGNDVEPTVTVTAATKAELDAEGVKVYAENGTNVVGKPYNADPTCTAMGKTTYKVVVADPDGKEVETKYLQDSQAAAKTGHVKGALKGYKLLEKSEADYDSEEAAIQAGKDAHKSVVKVTSKTVEGATKYNYWFYGELAEIAGTKVSNTVKAVEVAPKNLEEDGSFTIMPVFFCNFEDENEVDDKAEVVKPLADAKTAAEAADGKHSKCVKWAYESKAITYTFGTGAAQSTFTSTLNFSETDKAEKYFSHVSDGTMYNVIEQPTCKHEGTALIKCAICGDGEVPVTIPKLPDTFGAWTPSRPGQTLPDIEDFVIDGVVLSGTKHTITLNADKTEAVVTPTCTQPGGTFKYCTAGEHWVVMEATPATGHNLITVVTGAWGDPQPDYAADKNDYRYIGFMMCSNPACDGYVLPIADGLYEVTFHSKKGTDTLTDKYDAIEIVKEAKGKDCATKAKTTYTVKGIKDRTGAAITATAEGDDSTRGDHILEVQNFNWSSDFEAATVTTKCTFKDCPEANKTFTKEAKVAKATDSTGLTTYTASYGGTLGAKTDVKKAYTLKGAEVTYDTSKLTDGNLVLGVPGAAAQTPEVTVKLNGTVIDSSELEEHWGYTGNTVTLYVTWAEDKAFDDDATVMTGNANTRAYAKEYHVAAKTRFAAPTYTVKQGTKTVTVASKEYDGVYDAATKWSVEAATTVKGAAVKYAVVDAEAEDQKAIDALDYSLDKVDDIQNAGTYYVYAQLSKDGYTNYSVLAAEITIEKKSVKAQVDNFTMKQGETPSFNMTILDSVTGAPIDVDKSAFTVTSAGGQKLEDLLPGDYRILVSSENYAVYTEFIEGRVGTVTVLTKEGKTPEQDAKDAAEAADLALADAAKIDAKGYTADSVKAVEDAVTALKDAIENNRSTAEIKAATAALNEAINNAVALKSNPMVAKGKTVKASAKKTKKFAKSKAFTVKKAQGKVTFKKTKGSKKVTVSKAGKVTVKKGLKKGKTYKIKVKITAAGNAEYKSKSKTVTLKVKVGK
ncbi:MAG: hypothetical protein IKF07_05460 [Eubacterium sp.]|nr:hypothetical protein [Eubacterium sp.]